MLKEAALGQALCPAVSHPPSPADDDAFEPVEASLPALGDASSDGIMPQHLEQPLPPPGSSLADLEDSVDSSSALLMSPAPAPGGSTPVSEALPVGGQHSRSPLNTMV